MICYRDKTFCDSDCSNTACSRYLSEQDQDNAQDLGLPIALCNFSIDCAEYEPELKQEMRK